MSDGSADDRHRQQQGDDQQRERDDARDGERQRHAEPGERVQRAAPVRLELQPRDHRRPWTSTWPELLSACREKGASLVATTPSMSRPPDALSASTW